MKISAKKVVSVFADVTYNGWDYKVYPDGTVMKWEVWDYVHMSECDDGYDEIKAAGLDVLK